MLTYVWDLAWKKRLPELTVSFLIYFMCSENGDVAFDSCLHSVDLSVKYPRFSWLSGFKDRGFAGCFVHWAESYWDLAGLQQCVWGASASEKSMRQIRVSY